MPENDTDTPDPRVAELQATAEAFRAELAATDERVRELMAAEDPAGGVFHHEEIHAAKQERMRLRVEIDLCERKLRRIELGMEPDVDPGHSPEGSGQAPGGSGWLF